MNDVLDFMKKNDIPVTRENYLDIAYLGNPPEPLLAEDEANLPEELQQTSTNTAGVDALKS